MNIWVRLKQKFLAIPFRLLDWLVLFPKRIIRILWHCYLPFSGRRKKVFFEGLKVYPRARMAFWLLELFLLVLDLTGIVEIYETLADLIKWNTRPLNAREKNLAKSIYRNKLNYSRIRIDEKAHLGPPQFHICYVSFYTINTYGTMSDELLIHELMHVWQYQNLGIIYIPRALAAQSSMMGYNYGGKSALEKAIENGLRLDYFNLEQQADIVSDYFRIKRGLHPKWGDGKRSDLPLYEDVLKDLFPI